MKNNPYDALVSFINWNKIQPKEEKRLRKIIIDIKDYENNESMNFHECSECNCRCNCSTAECSCNCRSEL